MDYVSGWERQASKASKAAADEQPAAVTIDTGPSAITIYIYIYILRERER